jgi:hypothetical protein
MLHGLLCFSKVSKEQHMLCTRGIALERHCAQPSDTVRCVIFAVADNAVVPVHVRDTKPFLLCVTGCVGGFGKVGNEAAECQVCPKGTYSDEGAASDTQCTPCSTLGAGFTTAGNTSVSAASCTSESTRSLAWVLSA